MSIFRILVLTCSIGFNAHAITQGDNFILLGQKINQASGLTSVQISQLDKVLSDAQEILNNGQVAEGYICITGTLYGPNGFEKWTGDSNYCGKAVLD